MRLALQATYDDLEGTTDESRRRRARCERELEQNRRSFAFYRKLSSVVDDPNVKAPDVFAQESFPDPNVVAEYLDYRSESDEIAAEYERVCWDSPEALAEVGDCYDILVNDLTKQLVPPKNCRRRLYYVAWEDAQIEQNEGTRRDQEQIERVAEDEYLPRASNADSKGKTSRTSVKREEKRKVRHNSGKNVATSRKESDVQRTMRRARSVKRRLRDYAVNAIVLLCVLAFGIWALNKTRDDRNSETFQLATEQTREAARSENSVSDAEIKRAETPLVADLRVGENDEREAEPNVDAPFDWGTAPNPFDDINDDALAITHVDEEQVDATIPGVSVASRPADFDQERSETSDSFQRIDAQTSGARRVRVGLRGFDGTRRSSVEIPSQNNDVFAPTQRY